LREETKTVRKRQQECFVFHHNDFPNKELYAVKRWVHVVKAPPTPFPSYNPPSIASPDSENDSTLIGDPVNDGHHYREEGFEIDDDKAPLDENVTPDPIQNLTYSDWGWDLLDPQKVNGSARTGDRFIEDQINRPVDPKNVLLSIFLHMIPWEFILKTVIPETNSKMSTPMSVGKFLQYLGIQMMMGTVNGQKTSDFWLVRKKSMFVGSPFQFNNIMSRKRIEEITTKLSMTSIPPPAYEDPFHEIREWIEAFNKNMKDVFVPSWILVWTNQFRSGQTDSHVQDGCLFPESHIRKETNIIHCVMATLE